MPTDGNPMLTKNLPKVPAADLAVSDGLMGDTAERGTVLITLEEAMKFLDMKRGYHVNRNLLDNACWDNIYNVVNQRGLEEYIEVGYSIDRWKSSGLIVRIENGLTLSNPHTDNRVLWQPIKGYSNIVDKKMTFSWLERNGNLHIGTQIISRYEAQHTLLSCSTTGDGIWADIYLPPSGWDTDIFWVRFIVLPGVTSSVEGAKLEFGPAQTFAHKEGNRWIRNDPAPDYGLELAKCQRYQRMIANGTYQFIASGVTTIETDSVLLFIPIPVSMRVKPTVEMSNLVVFYDDPKTEIAVTKVVNVYLTPSGVRLILQLASSIPANTFYQVGTTTTSGSLLLNSNN